MAEGPHVIDELLDRFAGKSIRPQEVRDGVPTFWTPAEKACEVLGFLKAGIGRPYRMLFDLTAVDERMRRDKFSGDRPEADFTVVYHLLSYERNEDIRVKVPLKGDYPSLKSIVGIWPAANWYEREVWDMFGICFDGHPDLKRILMPPWWEGHPLRKEHPARGTELGPFSLPDIKETAEEESLKFRPETFGIEKEREDTDLVFLNMGPQHLGTHGPVRFVLEMEGEEIVNVFPDIGYHHRGDEKMGERQSWHSFVPYTDRVDYLAGHLNELPYVLAAEKLAGIKVPDKAKVVRVMLAELFRCINHLVWYGTFTMDTGAMSPVFYTFTDREEIFRIIEAVAGGRMHPMWFRIGGLAQDLPEGWDGMVRQFVKKFPRRISEYDEIVMKNRIFKMRTRGIGKYRLDEAIEWGVTGPNLRACGFEWDLRKKRPYSGYDEFEFEVPTATGGDCYSRAMIRVEEMRQSVRIIEQCLENMPPGDYLSRDTLASPPLKEYTLKDIETLITHFLNVSWGPAFPPGEASFTIESGKGNYAYYLVSDGGTASYRTRIRTPSFAHVQTVPNLCRGYTISDMVAILGSLDYIPSDVDR